MAIKKLRGPKTALSQFLFRIPYCTYTYSVPFVLLVLAGMSKILLFYSKRFWSPGNLAPHGSSLETIYGILIDAIKGLLRNHLKCIFKSICKDPLVKAFQGTRKHIGAVLQDIRIL